MLSIKGGGGGVKRYMSLAGLRWSNYDLKCWTDAFLYFYFQRCANMDFFGLNTRQSINTKRTVPHSIIRREILTEKVVFRCCSLVFHKTSIHL